MKHPHAHSHSPGGAPHPAHVGSTIAPSLLGLSAAQRLGLAGIAVALLWLCVFWALN